MGRVPRRESAKDQDWVTVSWGLRCPFHHITDGFSDIQKRNARAELKRKAGGFFSFYNHQIKLVDAFPRLVSSVFRSMRTIDKLLGCFNSRKHLNYCPHKEASIWNMLGTYRTWRMFPLKSLLDFVWRVTASYSCASWHKFRTFLWPFCWMEALLYQAV